MHTRSLIAAVALAAGLSWSATNPITEIQNKDHALQTFLKHHSSNFTKVQQDSLKQLINGIFDFQELGKRSMGSNWSKLTKAQQTQFISTFKTMVENTSIKRLENYRSDSAHYTVKGSGAKTVVNGTVWYKGRSSKVSYKLQQVNGQWRAYDLVLGGLSTMQNYHDQFSGIMKKEGFNGLMTRLRKNSST